MTVQTSNSIIKRRSSISDLICCCTLLSKNSLSSLQSLIKHSLLTIRSVRVSNSLLLRLSSSHSRLQSRGIVTVQTSNSIIKRRSSIRNFFLCCTSFLYNAFCRVYSIVKSILLLSRSILIRNIILLIFCFCKLCHQLSLVVTIKFINSLLECSQCSINSLLLLLRKLLRLIVLSFSKSGLCLLQSLIKRRLLCFRSILILICVLRLRSSNTGQLLSIINRCLKLISLNFAIKTINCIIQLVFCFTDFSI